jgi:hypothetical protein
MVSEPGGIEFELQPHIFRRAWILQQYTIHSQFLKSISLHDDMFPCLEVKKNLILKIVL